MGGLQGEAKPREFGMAVAGRTSSKVEEEFQEGINSDREAEDSDIMLYTGLFLEKQKQALNVRLEGLIGTCMIQGNNT